MCSVGASTQAPVKSRDGTAVAEVVGMLNHQTNPKHVENSTDATRGEPLALRAQTRVAELEAALAKLPAGEQRARNDIEVALSALSSFLTGDVDHMTDATAADLNRVLEGCKHLAEVAVSDPQ
jgi:hypothetical protein